MPRHYPGYRPDRRRQPVRDKDREYLQMKEMWRASHPDATPQEYEDAMKRIAREIGL